MSVFVKGNQLVTLNDIKVDYENQLLHSAVDWTDAKLAKDGTCWVFDFQKWANNALTALTWTLSVWIDNRQGKAPLHIQAWSQSTGMHTGNNVFAGKVGKSKVNFTVPDPGSFNNGNIVIATDLTSNVNLDFSFKYKHEMLTEGTVDVPWHPAYSDYAKQSDLDSIKSDIAALKSKLGG